MNKNILINLDMTREDFFEIMEKIFYEALAEVVAGKGLSMPQKFFCKFFCEEEMDCATELTFTTCDVLVTKIIFLN